MSEITTTTPMWNSAAFGFRNAFMVVTGTVTTRPQPDFWDSVSERFRFRIDALRFFGNL